MSNNKRRNTKQNTAKTVQKSNKYTATQKHKGSKNKVANKQKTKTTTSCEKKSLLTRFVNALKFRSKKLSEGQKTKVVLDDKMYKVAIKDGYVFKVKEGQKTKKHIYLAYKDKTTEEVRLIPTTHLYEIPSKKKKLLDKKHLQKENLPKEQFPSGIKNYYFNKSVDGKPIDIAKATKLDKSLVIPENQKKKIIKFAKYDSVTLENKIDKSMKFAYKKENT